ncbi:DUF3160 domain-containing protein [Breznakiella homolactica]|uniref:DUF3160 domain-containing protein n=1 Tax=Breznakiella homolactica TaxID=2798577 RepID=A0A7T7XQ88_9SPIR|nr:DUF3160 domain-containing protein [Breznakiella homolactica]QQO10449.1 DUF3160 domain-containing protein [Breznakiella homolactica]
MNMKRLSYCFCIIAVLCVSACGKEDSGPKPPDTSQSMDTDSAQEVPQEDQSRDGTANRPQKNIPELSALLLPPIADPVTAAHREYLGEELIFTDIPGLEETGKKTAVVGSSKCRFFPNVTVSSPTDLETLPAGIPVPIGTLLPITGDKIVNRTSQYEWFNVFTFEDNFNWFYPTEYNGEPGIVFGADLYGLGKSETENRIAAMLYSTEGRFDSFYPISGYSILPGEVREALEKNRLVIQEVTKNEYRLSADKPDDLIALYMDLYKTSYSSYSDNTYRRIPVFITTDLAAHGQHILFDRIMQALEEDFFVPRLKKLMKNYTAGLAGTDHSGFSETYEKAVLYLQVAEALLDLAPEKIEQQDRYGRSETTYRDKDREQVLSRYPDLVRQEIAKIDAAEGFSPSPVFTFKNGAVLEEDYSQYILRGHYTKNGILAAYFRTMMWFGRIHFLISVTDPAVAAASGSAAIGGTDSPERSQNPDWLNQPLWEKDDSVKLALGMIPAAMLLTKTAADNPALYEEWQSLFDPITALIGESDDLSFKEILPFWQKENIRDFSSWAADPEAVLAFGAKAHRELRPPALSGGSVFKGPSDGEDRKPPMGWRLFGQRFTYDSGIHHAVSPPRFMPRDMVRGLDIMKAFGSKTADALLELSDYPVMDGLKEILDEQEKEFDSYDETFWTRNYYNSVLSQIKTQAQFESGSGFYFTESPLWGIKSMLASHGTWAELRHDTILYVKQSYAERAGGDDEATFRTEPVPHPAHYIEPNLPFWRGTVQSVNILHRTLAQYNMLDERTASVLQRFSRLCERALGIAMAEFDNKPVDEKELRWIPTIPLELAQMVLFQEPQGGYAEDTEQFRMALVADVFTNGELGMVLETAVGIPYRMYIPLNDAQGGKRIAMGYCFSYFEFNYPMSQRMTNETWKSIVYADKTNMAKYMPFWTNGILLPPAKPQK